VRISSLCWTHAPWRTRMPSKSDAHQWVDESMRPNGRSWQHGVRFVCTRCGIERRKTEEGRDRFYLRGKKVELTVACIGGVR
jgi:hypothetical protein